MHRPQLQRGSDAACGSRLARDRRSGLPSCSLPDLANTIARHGDLHARTRSGGCLPHEDKCKRTNGVRHLFWLKRYL